MKKIITIILCIIVFTMTMTILCGCNKQIIDFKYKFDYAYIKVGEEWVNVKVDKWNDYEGEQIQIILSDGTVLLLSSVNCILYKGNLPN